MATLVGTGANPGPPLSAITAGDLSGKEGYVVNSTGAASPPTVELADSTTADTPLGVLLSVASSATGAAATYCNSGRVAVKAGGTCSAGSPAMVDAGDAGKVLDATGNVKTVGTFVEDGVDGDLVLMDVCPGAIGTG